MQAFWRAAKFLAAISEKKRQTEKKKQMKETPSKPQQPAR